MALLKQWFKVSSNDTKLLRDVELLAFSEGVKYHVNRDDDNYPPTVWVLADARTMMTIESKLGIRRW